MQDQSGVNAGKLGLGHCVLRKFKLCEAKHDTKTAVRDERIRWKLKLSLMSKQSTLLLSVVQAESQRANCSAAAVAAAK